MKKKLLLLSSCILSFAAMAQRQQYGLPTRPLKNEIFASRHFDLASVKDQSAPVQKPTVIQQRMIASANRKAGGNTPPQLKDSSRYLYSGTRGASPLRDAHNVQTLADFDTAFIFLGIDNFITSRPLYRQQFNSNNDLTQSEKYGTPATIPEQKWITYTPDHKIKKGTSLSGDINSTDWRFEEVTLDEAGKIVKDSIVSQSSAFGLDQELYENQYGANGRKEITSSFFSSAGVDYLTLTYYYFSNATSRQPYKDSTVKTTFSGGSPTSVRTEVGQYTYDASDSLTDYTIYVEPGHEPFIKNTYIYTTSGLILTRINQQYDNTTSSWRNTGKTEYTYTQSKMTAFVSSLWDTPTGNWKETQKATISFTANGLIDTVKNYMENVLYTTNTYAYDNNKNRTRYAEYITGSSGNLITTDIYNYYYEDYEDGKTGIRLYPKNNLAVILYPNPAANTLHYRIQTGKQPATLQLNVYDAMGRKVYTSANLKNEGAADISKLAPGNYYLEISSTKQNLWFRQSFIKQ